MKKREWKVCGSKSVFKDERHAKRVGKHLGLRAYECHICKKYHLTSQAEGNHNAKFVRD